MRGLLLQVIALYSSMSNVAAAAAREIGCRLESRADGSDSVLVMQRHQRDML